MEKRIKYYKTIRGFRKKRWHCYLKNDNIISQSINGLINNLKSPEFWLYELGYVQFEKYIKIDTWILKFKYPQYRHLKKYKK